MVRIGEYNQMTVLRKTSIGVYLDDGEEGILLPKRFAPPKLQVGDTIEVFLYHDSDNRVIATTQQPKGILGDIVLLECVAITAAGAFLDWGLMKDLFIARSQQVSFFRKGGEYLVKIYLDEQTGRLAATEKFTSLLNNDDLRLEEREEVDLVAWRQTEIGWMMIINQSYTGLLHDSDIFREIRVGDTMRGFIKTIRPDNKIDLAIGKAGYQKVEDESARILRLLQEAGGFLPYHDKSAPEDIYAVFGMSKKTFKMTVGALYRQRKIALEAEGIRLL